MLAPQQLKHRCSPDTKNGRRRLAPRRSVQCGATLVVGQIRDGAMQGRLGQTHDLIEMEMAGCQGG